MDERKPMDNRQLDDQRLDNQLAEFTDRLLQGAKDVSLSTQDAELRALQNTVKMLKTAVVDDQPSQEVAGRIGASLQREWQKQHPVRKNDDALASFKQFLRRPGRVAPRTFALGFAAMFVLALVIFYLSPALSSPPTGTAGGSSGLIPLAAIVVVVVVGLIWFWRSRR